MTRPLTMFAILALSGLGLQAEAAPSYTVTRIGFGLEGTSLNDVGQVAGYRVDRSGSVQPFLYSPGLGVEIIGGPAARGYGWELNNRGQVAGEGGSATAFSGAFLYTPGAGVQRLVSGGDYSAGYGLNERGVVVGSWRVGHDNHAFIYRPGAGVQDIDAGHPRDSYAHAINAAGQVVGFAYGNMHQPHAFVYTAEKGMVDVSGGYGYSVLWDINQHGVAVGDFGADLNSRRATLVDTASGSVTPLPFSSEWLGFCQTQGLNDAGQVVGTSDYQSAGGVGLRAFLFDPGESRVLALDTLIDPALGLSLVSAVDINNKGQILATGDVRGGGFAAYVLTPVPEPETMLLLAAGLVLLACRGRRAAGPADRIDLHPWPRRHAAHEAETRARGPDNDKQDWHASEH
ncbi:DUF3466 family protein [Aquabacterium sp. A7-Y]|uniref:PEP-CTERM sorting domain-containing protein n=1 Tax=Aquabacterium sp. A7-Y TaxID=1349605 RepID=UPI00223D30A6|nr:PEP-CTERM sorting domain-containing protein [Aquabacterium sp. A7-Y]MCW7541647.1 DUF3466 family protein [Aquabacterium sp. A7-Y]